MPKILLNSGRPDKARARAEPSRGRAMPNLATGTCAACGVGPGWKGAESGTRRYLDAVKASYASRRSRSVPWVSPRTTAGMSGIALLPKLATVGMVTRQKSVLATRRTKESCVFHTLYVGPAASSGRVNPDWRTFVGPFHRDLGIGRGSPSGYRTATWF